MMSVKHINGESQSVREVTGVRKDDGKIYADLENGNVVTYNGGIVYVMNDAGATIAKYDLT